MPILSVNELDLIPTMALNQTLARHFDPDMPDAKALGMLDTAQHEAAHAVAGLACGPMACLTRIVVSPRIAAGQVHDALALETHDAFSYFAGYAWEQRHGDVENAHDDYTRGVESARRAGVAHEPILAAAHRFVAVDAALIIQHAAIGILCLADKKGVLKGPRLRALSRWLRPRTPQMAHALKLLGS